MPCTFHRIQILQHLVDGILDLVHHVYKAMITGPQDKVCISMFGQEDDWAQ